MVLGLTENGKPQKNTRSAKKRICTRQILEFSAFFRGELIDQKMKRRKT